ncbi:MAG: type II toxin-antitoxin system VapC family toxin [Armatimonadia bacterium]
MIYYFDTSVLVKLFVEEVGSAQTSVLVLRLEQSQTDQTFVSRLVLVELAATIARAAREQRVSLEYGATTQAVLRAGMPSPWQMQELAPEVALRAMEMLEKHALRAADAIHLASALTVRADVFGCADRRLCEAAAAEGLSVFNPTE